MASRVLCMYACKQLLTGQGCRQAPGAFYYLFSLSGALWCPSLILRNTEDPESPISALQHSYETLKAVDGELERVLNDSYSNVKAMLQRSRACYDELIRSLMAHSEQTLSGEEVRALVDRHACSEDLDRRNLERSAFL